MISAFLSSAFFGITLTIAAFLLGLFIQKKTGSLLANPLVISAVTIIPLLLLLDIPYADYAKGGDIVQLMLGPVTALLALGIYNQRTVLKAYFLPVLVGCFVGSAVSLASVLLLCRLLNVDQSICAALLPKSCTTPIAVSIAEGYGGLGSIAAFAVVITGIVGALGAPFFSKWFGITDPVAQGLAIGACSHALGTTRARELGELQGAMSSIAIGICGLCSVFLCLFIQL